MLSAVTARINAAVKSGKLTQVQATKILDKLKTELPKLMDRVHKPPANGTTKPGAHSFGAIGAIGRGASLMPRGDGDWDHEAATPPGINGREQVDR